MEECIVIFKTSLLQIKDYVLLITGKIHGQLHVGFLQILGNFLDGHYLIGIYQESQEYLVVKVPSMTSIREDIYQFEDHLSFERATFIIFEDKIIRFRCVRSLIKFSGEEILQNEKA